MKQKQLLKDRYALLLVGIRDGGWYSYHDAYEAGLPRLARTQRWSHTKYLLERQYVEVQEAMEGDLRVKHMRITMLGKNELLHKRQQKAKELKKALSRVKSLSKTWDIAIDTGYLSGARKIESN